MMIVDLLLLAAGFVLLLKGADWLVKGSATAARKMGVSDLVVGLTIVAFGTSAPELVVNTLGAARDLNEMVLGNVLGSNIFNILVILGLTAMIRPVTISLKTIRSEIPYSLLGGLVVFVMANDHFFASVPDRITRTDSLILLGFFILFIYLVFRHVKDDRELSVPFTATAKNQTLILLIAAGFAGLIFGGKLVVDHAQRIAENVGLSQRMIGLTIVAAGTSLPELATSAVAAWRGNSDLAIGNVIGSNIFNIFFILGLSGLISPVSFNPVFNTDVLLYIAATLLILISMLTGRKRIIDRWEGAVFLLIYIGYTIHLIHRS